MKRYNPTEIEQKWQKNWEETEPFKATDNSEVPKVYLAEMFPYPSGAGLHVGHVRNFSIVDVLARFHAQNGMNVLRPFGYDTFGLPAENCAIKTGISPQEATSTNIENFRNQLKKLGFFVDWSREINTSDPEYYRWTQWCFLELYKKGLAYQAENYQWWCPIDQTVLANEQVENGHCWRCGSEVEKKKMKQWFFKITEYADELLDEIDALDWPEKIKTMQKNWIGRSIGAEINFPIASGADLPNSFSPEFPPAKTATYIPDGTDKVAVGEARLQSLPDSQRMTSPAETGSGEKDVRKSAATEITVFTTRPDTIFGATFLVLAPEHPLVPKLVNDDTRQTVDKYREQTLKKSEIERQENREKTGVFTGSFATNPATGEKIPIWVADYVLMGYGTGAIMAVPAHDERDQAFAEKFDLPIVKVIDDKGIMQNSGILDGKNSNTIREEVIEWIEREHIGHAKTIYRMHDWLISRQRYWGAPIPIAYDKNGNPHPIPESELPVILPVVTDYQPDNSGRSALAKENDWLKVTINGEEMVRETDTMDGYACSSWYLWRYADPHNSEQAWSPDLANYWNPIDFYVGGDHAVAHLLYIRFWTKFFADQGLLGFREPVKKLLYNGYINAPDGKKMSKSKGNVIDPLEIIDQGYGADTLRTYELFIGPYDLDAAWDPRAIGGVYRFLNRCWTLAQSVMEKPEVDNSQGIRRAGVENHNSHSSQRVGSPACQVRSSENEPECCDFDTARGSRPENYPTLVSRNRTIKKVTEDIRRNSFNTAVAALMEYVNELYRAPHEKEDIITLAKLLKPFAPHLSSEILEQLSADDSWPEWEDKYLVSDTVEFVVQVNGKLRAHITLPADQSTDQKLIEESALAAPKIKEILAGETPKCIIALPSRRLVNIVV